MSYAEHALIRQTVYLRVLSLVVLNTCNVRQDNTLFSLSNTSEVFTTNIHTSWLCTSHSLSRKKKNIYFYVIADDLLLLSLFFNWRLIWRTCVILDSAFADSQNATEENDTREETIEEEKEEEKEEATRTSNDDATSPAVEITSPDLPESILSTRDTEEKREEINGEREREEIDKEEERKEETRNVEKTESESGA